MMVRLLWVNILQTEIAFEICYRYKKYENL